MEQYPNDLSKVTIHDLKLRQIFCEFATATILVALARNESEIEVSKQNYHESRKHILSFVELVTEMIELLDEAGNKDMHQKLSILLYYDFEAACKLQQYDGLGEIIVKAIACESMRTYQLMADCLLCSPASSHGKSAIHNDCAIWRSNSLQRL